MSTATKAGPVVVTKIAHFVFKKETPGAVQFLEKGDDRAKHLMGTCYLRKSTIEGGSIPAELEIRITYEAN